jgi:hypothetical protein
MAAGRRDFLETVALGAVGAAALETMEPAGLAAQSGSIKWNLSWVRKLSGRYRAVFDVTSIEDGFGVWRAAIWRKQFANIFGMPERSLGTVVNVRHDGIALVLNQEYWARYGVAKQWNVRDPATRQPTARNPVIERTGANALPSEYEDFTLERLMEGGAIVLACALALRDCATVVAQADRVSMEAAEARVRDSVVPGVILQPSGVFSAVLAQENGCRYVRAS